MYCSLFYNFLFFLPYILRLGPLFVVDPALAPAHALCCYFVFFTWDIIMLLSLVASFDGRLPALVTFHCVLLVSFDIYCLFDLFRKINPLSLLLSLLFLYGKQFGAQLLPPHACGAAYWLPPWSWYSARCPISFKNISLNHKLGHNLWYTFGAGPLSAGGDSTHFPCPWE